MPARIPVAILLVALSVAGTTSGSARESAPATGPLAETDPQARARNAETFDAMWTTVRDSHWDPAAVGKPWDDVRDELRPAAEAAPDAAALRAVLAKALARLGQSHFTIIPADLSSSSAGAPARRSGRSGVTMAYFPATDGAGFAAIVVAVDPGSPAESAGIEPGMRVESIDGRSPCEKLPAGEGLERHERAAIADALASGEPGQSSTWRIEQPGAAAREVTVAFAADERPRTSFGALPPMPTELTWRHLDATERERWGAGDREIGLVRFNVWLIPVMRPFDIAMDTLRTADGIVIDLRGNPGGIGAMSMGVAGHFTARPEGLGEMRTRDACLRFVSNPRRTDSGGHPVEPYSGPLAILVDERSASTSEIFAGGLQHLGRARVFGARTAGAALPAITTPLPNGDVFLHAFADYRLPDGTPLEATGVRPDGARPYDRSDFAREGDPALAEAVRWIASQPRAAPAKDPMP